MFGHDTNGTGLRYVGCLCGFLIGRILSSLVGTHRRGVRIGCPWFKCGRFIEPSLPRVAPEFGQAHVSL